jgi:outer membrane immunogenic protein
VGYAWGNTLLYATGGVAFAEIKSSFSTIAGYAPLGTQSFSNTRAGDTVGVGIEYKFSSRWIGRLEYRYTSFGTVSNSITSGGGLE